MTKAVLKGFFFLLLLLLLFLAGGTSLSAPKLVSLSWKHNTQFLCRKAELNYF